MNNKIWIAKYRFWYLSTWLSVLNWEFQHSKYSGRVYQTVSINKNRKKFEKKNSILKNNFKNQYIWRSTAEMRFIVVVRCNSRLFINCWFIDWIRNYPYIHLIYTIEIRNCPWIYFSVIKPKENVKTFCLSYFQNSIFVYFDWFWHLLFK